jgi:hypothetical protein
MYPGNETDYPSARVYGQYWYRIGICGFVVLDYSFRFFRQPLAACHGNDVSDIRVFRIVTDRPAGKLPVMDHDHI